MFGRGAKHVGIGGVGGFGMVFVCWGGVCGVFVYCLFLGHFCGPFFGPAGEGFTSADVRHPKIQRGPLRFWFLFFVLLFFCGCWGVLGGSGASRGLPRAPRAGLFEIYVKTVFMLTRTILISKVEAS